MIFSLLAASALFAAGQDTPAAQNGPPKRVRSVLLFGDEKCPPARDAEEVVVCASAGESPYRIPKRFRERPAEGPTGQAWSRRMEVVDEVNRRAAGLPNSCSNVGMAGQTGCTQQMIRQWAQERLDRERQEAREIGP